MATITRTVEETLIFTAKPPQKQKKLKLEQPSSEILEDRKLVGPLLCPPDCEDCKRMTSQFQQCPPGCKECKEMSQPNICPPDCLTCKKQCSNNTKNVPLLFNAIGIIVAILATYMILSTDSHLYLVFWICYSVLRRLMTKCKPREKTD